MSCTTNKKNKALMKAVEEENSSTVRDLLDQGADPNAFFGKDASLLQLAVRKSNVEIIKLLVQYRANINAPEMWRKNNLLNYVFDPVNNHYCKELLAHMIKYNDKELIHDVYVELADMQCECKGPLALEVLDLLLDHGLPIDDFIKGTTFLYLKDSYTPLQLAVREDKMDFVLLLLNRGADIHKKTKMGMNCIWVNVDSCSEEMIKLLVKKGVQINERLYEGDTALHRACYNSDASTIRILFKYGADPNILDDFGNVPLFYEMVAGHMFRGKDEAMAEELAKMKVENQFICRENLQYLKENEYSQKIFVECLEELQKMKDSIFYSGFSLYDTFKSSKKCKKLIFMTKNKNFVAAFKSCRNQESLKHYGEDLDNIFKNALEKRDTLLAEEGHLCTVLKDCFPELVLRKLANFVNEDLFFND